MKQRLTGTRLHRELVKEGHQVEVTLVRDYLREVKRRKAEVSRVEITNGSARRSPTACQ